MTRNSVRAGLMIKKYDVTLNKIEVLSKSCREKKMKRNRKDEKVSVGNERRHGSLRNGKVQKRNPRPGQDEHKKFHLYSSNISYYIYIKINNKL